MKNQHKISTAAVVIPPFTDFYSTPHRFSTLGAGILIRLLEKNDITVRFFNFPVDNCHGKNIPIPKTLNYLKPFILPNETGRSSFFTQYYHYGPPLQECVQQIISTEPDIVFISCFAFCYADITISLCKELKKTLPTITIIAGGGGVSVNPHYFISSGSIDYALTGEAEISISPLLQFLRGATVDITSIPNLSTKSYISHLLSPTHFTNDSTIEPGFRTSLKNDRLRLDLTISRGCPLDCAFCSNRLCHGTDFRHIDLYKVDEIIRSISKSLPCEPTTVVINFEDDNLLIDHKFWFNVLEKFKVRFPSAHFYAENGLDYRLLTQESAKYLISLGMTQFNIALGSVNKDSLHTLSRASSLNHYDELLTLFNQHSIQVITYFIAGIEGECREDIAENLLFLFQRPTLSGISMFYPVPGLPGFTNLSMFESGKSILCCGSSAYPWNKSVETVTIVTAFRLSRLLNLIKSTDHSSIERKLIETSLTKRKLYTLIRLKKEKVLIEVPLQDNHLAEMVLEAIDL
jgi:radical SAM superfamily enzyme YgiQ (UPF0313 family)